MMFGLHVEDGLVLPEYSIRFLKNFLYMVGYLVRGLFLRVGALLILITVLVFFGAFMAARLGVFQLGGVFQKVNQYFGLGSSRSIHSVTSTQLIDYDRSQAEKQRLEQWESLLHQMEIQIKENQKGLQQRMTELDAREKELFQKEENIKKTTKMYENIGDGLRVTADSLMNMPPEKAVEILLNMEDPAIISVFNMVNELSRESNKVSLVPVWMQIMPASRSADVVRKMSLN